jgi:nitrous oxidase accessory protein NosD
MLRRTKARWYGAAGLCLLALALLFGSLGSARSAQALSVLLVDDDGAQCPSALYATISDAIAAADSGDTIVVCPGTYDATTVDKRVTLSGYTADLSSKLSKCSDRLNNPADQTTKNSIVAGFYVAADFSTIKGFTVTAPESGINIPWGTDGVWVTRNVLQDNSIGVNLNGTMSLVDHNCIRENDAGGSATGTGIYSDQGLKSASINKNIFFNNPEVGITLLDFAGPGSLDDVHINNNVSSGDGDLIAIAGSTNSQIKGNTSTGAIGSGIFIEAGTFGPNSLLSVTGNTIQSSGDEGIFAEDGSLANSTIKNNTTKGNVTFGIHIADNNENNSITNNNFKNGGANNDCEDNSSGGGTAGTANTWKNDKGKTASPPGICK